MTSAPLRHRLFYDPLFIDLSRRLRGDSFGRIIGSQASAVVASPADFKQICSFFVLFWGKPVHAQLSADLSASLGRVLFLFDGFALSLDAAFVPSIASSPRAVALNGLISCARSLVEYRFGSEHLSAYAPSETECYPLAFPEGDGVFYRAMDESKAQPERMLTDARDDEAQSFVESLVSNRFDSFPGGRA